MSHARSPDDQDGVAPDELTASPESLRAPELNAVTPPRRAAVRRSTARPAWMTRFRVTGVFLDLCALAVATAVGVLFRPTGSAEHTVRYLVLGAVIIVGWVLALEYVGAYKLSHVSTGSEEAGRVLRASVTVLGVVGVLFYAADDLLGRGFVLVVIPVGTVLLLAQRTAFRGLVVDKAGSGAWSQPVVAIGSADSVRRLIAATARVRRAGVTIVGACVDDARLGETVAGVPVLGGVADAAEQADRTGANGVAVAGDGITPTEIEEIGWQLECVGRRLTVAHLLGDVIGRPVRPRTVGGLPVLWLEQAQLANVQRALKRVLDLLGGLILLALLSPVLLLTAIAIRLTSRGPVLFTQRRLGLNGSDFTIFKFRSMYVGAEDRRAEIIALNEQDGGGVLFKIRKDPRVTPVGRFIRKWSIDELPQLLNVLAGSMSLVGPRPLASADSHYSGRARRRLRVRPGLTGLWQISGRSDLSWDEAVRLDLYYVENWSLGLDVSILVRTLFAVLGGRGAY